MPSSSKSKIKDKLKRIDLVNEKVETNQYGKFVTIKLYEIETLYLHECVTANVHRRMSDQIPDDDKDIGFKEVKEDLKNLLKMFRPS